MVTLSDLKDLLWFENITPHNESMFPILGFGTLSIKQLGILGAGIMFTWSLWQKTGDYLAVIPVVIALILVVKKENVIPIEIKIIKILLFHIRKQDNVTPKNKPSIKNNYKSNSKLSIAKQYRVKSSNRQNFIKETNVRNIPYIYDRMFRMKIRLDNAKQMAVNSRVKIVLDDVLYETACPNSNNEIVVNFIPKYPGKNLLQVYADDTEPIYEEILNFIR
ncbi:MAG: putative membrane protein [Cenarchaeum symbiont of Oopsacas minuta]|nr:putative membrane protein [Cenarchaeum symbiont of Oopsacas minuta]